MDIDHLRRVGQFQQSRGVPITPRNERLAAEAAKCLENTVRLVQCAVAAIGRERLQRTNGMTVLTQQPRHPNVTNTANPTQRHHGSPLAFAQFGHGRR
jgi:hypothetical protein